MNEKIFRVLFLCTGNSARSILAECILNRLGHGNFRGYSAGSQPKGEVFPAVQTFLERNNYDTSGLRSKVWDEFAEERALEIDFVFTVCDNAAAEVCPVWPGHPLTAHWGVPDPATFVGSEVESQQFISSVHNLLETRIKAFLDIPFESLDLPSLKKRLDSIGAID
ncbi:MAG: ArsR family transcriptional regulator [Magnetovibrio sp.]|nr:ArsR family transcriptional regulator [Magnetovibrio sp.]|tara:strand:+ start:1521 stop:2018 length:498 start_codon:yes stop_codon:yes gene_type:complete